MNAQRSWLIGLALVIVAAAGGAWIASAMLAAEPTEDASAAAQTWWTCPMHPEVHRDGPGQCPICGMALIERTQPPRAATPPPAAAQTVWTCPMHPEVQRDAPGQCPICGMALIEREAGNVAGAAGGAAPDAAHAPSEAVTIDPHMVQNLGIRTAPVTRGDFRQTLDTVGSVAVDERLIRVVESRAAGWIESQQVHTVGATVQAGQVLAGIYAPDLYAAQQEYLLALDSGDAALVDAARQRLLLLGASAAQIDAVRDRGSASREIRLLAPIDGIVVDLQAHEGRQISPGMPLMRIANLSRVWVHAELPEAQAGWIEVGDAAEAIPRGQADAPLQGRVDYLYPTVDAASRTVRARLVFDNPQGRLRPGQFVDVRLDGGAREDVLTIPAEALIRTGARNTVIVADGDGRFRPVAVSVAAEHGDIALIADGLSAGDTVVVSGQFLIDSEASLQGAYRRMPGGDPSTEAPHAH